MSLTTGPSVENTFPANTPFASYYSKVTIAKDNSKYIFHQYYSDTSPYYIPKPDGSPSTVSLQVVSGGSAFALIKYSSTNVPLWGAVIDCDNANLDMMRVYESPIDRKVYVSFTASGGGSNKMVYNSDGTLATNQLVSSATAFVIRYTSEGIVDNVMSFTGTFLIYGVQCDSNNNVITAGTLDSANLVININGASTNYNNMIGNIFIFKVPSTSTTIEWLNTIRGTATCNLTIDGSDNIYIPFKFTTTNDDAVVYYNTIPLEVLRHKTKTEKGALIRLSTSGVPTWTIVFHCDTSTFETTIDKWNNVYIQFYYATTKSSRTIMDALGREVSLKRNAASSAQSSTMCLLKVTPYGSYLWHSIMESINNSIVSNVICDYMGNVCIIAHSVSTLEPQKIYNADGTLYSTPTIQNNAVCPFITLFSPQGQVIYTVYPTDVGYVSGDEYYGVCLASSQSETSSSSLKIIANLSHFYPAKNTFNFNTGQNFSVTDNYGGIITITYDLTYEQHIGFVTKKELDVPIFLNAQSNDLLMCTNQATQSFHIGCSNNNKSSLRVHNNGIECTNDLIVEGATVLRDVFIYGDIKLNSGVSFKKLTIDNDASSNLDPTKEWSIIGSQSTYELTSQLPIDYNGFVKYVSNDYGSSAITLNIKVSDSASSNVQSLEIQPKTSQRLGWFNNRWINL